MRVTLCLDFGNTRLKCAVFHDQHLIELRVLSSDLLSDLQGIIDTFQPTHSILSSVINHDVALEELLQKHTQFHRLNHLSQLPFSTPVGKPSTIGADRLAICAAATDRFPHLHCLSIGLGTCITYNFTDKYHQFLGGSISPGLQMRFKAMHEQTALLPLVPAQHDFPLIGYDTNTNLQSGVILGMSKEIDGFIDAFKEKYHHLQVLLTGGDMSFFFPHLRNQLIADPNLLYQGLEVICRLNTR